MSQWLVSCSLVSSFKFGIYLLIEIEIHLIGEKKNARKEEVHGMFGFCFLFLIFNYKIIICFIFYLLFLTICIANNKNMRSIFFILIL